MADINGTAEADLLFGAASADLISGGDGNDVIYGGAGDDHLLGGDGDDILRGEAGNDLLEGGSGKDDLASTDAGNDTLAGGEGNDVLFVDRRRAGDSLVLDGGAGNDRIVIQLTAAAAALTAAGGDGDDAVEIFAIRSVLALSLGAGRDLVTPVGLRASVQGGGLIVISDFQAGAAGDRISLSSLSAADFAGWNPNSNPFAAGYLRAAQSGSDVIISASFTANGTFVDSIILQNVLLAGLTADNLGGWSWDGSAVAAQSIAGSGAGDTLRGNGGADEISGLGGDDILEGHAGADILWGGEGNDILRGGQGADELHGEAGNDTMTAESAGDSLFGEDGDDRLTLSAGAAAGTVYGFGGAGNDAISISGNSTTATFSVDAGLGADVVTIFSLAGSAVIALGDGQDRIDIDSFVKSDTSTATIEITDFATGDGGDRLEWMGFLERFMAGGPGSILLLQSGTDSLIQLQREGGQYVTLVNFRNTDLAAFTTYNLGGYGPDVPGTSLVGTADPDILFGTDGDDVIEGQDGADTLLGFFGDDEIHGGGGNDSIFGSYGDDVIDGGEGNDVINAGQGDDLADGGEGNDQFVDNSSLALGNKGFVGGAGDDSFYFFRSSNSGDTLVAVGGDGNDYFQAQNTLSSGGFVLDGGGGNDIFDVQGRGNLTLGPGVDEVRFSDAPIGLNFQSTIVVQDFAIGDLGDRLTFAGLVARFANFTPTTNPFTSGFMKLVQSGPHTMILIDLDGPSGSGQNRLVAILSGIQKYSLTSHNIGGYGLPFSLGTGADELFQGSALDDDFVGGGGNDTFIVGYGGNDIATGGSGNDLFYVATLNNYGIGNVTIAGGGGTDTLQVQSKSADMYLQLRPGSFAAPAGIPVTASGIEIVQLLSGFDSSRGWALGSAVAYTLDIADGFAPTGGPLILDSSLLAASERLSLGPDALHDSDAFLNLVGGAGVDRVYAGAGGSYLDGGGGDDELFTGLGNDVLIGGAGADVLGVRASAAASNVDTVDGGEGNDRVQLFSVNGAVTVTLGAGSDTIEFPTDGINGIGVLIGRNVTVTDFAAGPGGDTLNWSSALFSYLSGYSGANPFASSHARLVQDGGDVLLQLSRLADTDYLTLLRLQNHVVADFASGLGGFVPPAGNGGADVLTGSAGDDQIDGGAGNDFIDGGAGADRMIGGTGSDVFFVDDAGDQVIEMAGEGIDEVRTSLATYSLFGTHIERLTATSGGAHDFRGNSGDNVVTGGTGNDFIRLMDGGSDRANGGAGNDVFLFGGTLTLSDVIDGGPGTDQIAVQGNYSGGMMLGANVASVENLAILPGNDTRFGDPGTNFYDYVFAATDDAVATGAQLVVDANRLRPGEDFTFNGSGETGGSFFIYGGAGVDLLTGGAKNDVFLFGAWDQFGASDVITGGAGIDQLALRGNYTLTFGAGQLIGIENIGLLSAHDTRFGALGSSYSYDLTMVDANVAAGVQMVVDGAKLRIAEFFRFDGSAETDGSFRVFGGLVDDVIVGSRNGDLIQGNGGADTLTGGQGADVFRYLSASDSTSSATDRILDFAAGTDKIDLGRIDADTQTAGDQAFSWIGSSAFSGSAGQLRAYQEGSNWILQGDTDGDGSADFVVLVTPDGPTPLSASDFVL
jgi:Ca2+-binding RTX toxin-like protein